MSDRNAFIPRHFPRIKTLSESQQYQYDVLRTVGGKLIGGRNGWYREVPYTGIDGQSAMVREKIYGLNITAMWKLVDAKLIECVLDPVSGGFLFLLPALAKGVVGPRYRQVNHVVREVAAT